MHSKQLSSSSLSRTIEVAATATLVVAILFALTVFLTQPAQAQTYKVIYNFTGGEDGATPWAGLTIDAAGNLYGTTLLGGSHGSNCFASGCGTVFKLTPNGPDWTFNTLHSFSTSYATDGASASSRVIFGPDGTLFGTTEVGGYYGCANFFHCGTVFEVRPPAMGCNKGCGWTESVLYRFRPDEGQVPAFGDLVLDREGNIYGTTSVGSNNCGTAFQLTPFDGGWKKNVLHSFTCGRDGGSPDSGMIFDQAGNLYGTTPEGGSSPNCLGGCGTVFELTRSGSGWTENVLYSLQGGSDGIFPTGGLIFDQSGNLYGSTPYGGLSGGGTVFELSPEAGRWKFTVIYSLVGGSGPYGSLFMDAAGDLYGITWGGGAYGKGSVFKLTSSSSGWTYASLHDFTGGIDGHRPYGGVVFDAHGNLYGTASEGGANSCLGIGVGGGCGVVWEIIP